MNDLIERIIGWLNAAAGWAVWIALVAGAIIVLWFVWKLLGKRKTAADAPTDDLTIDVMRLGTEGPPTSPPRLEFYNVPVRLALIVMAPAGRVRDLPPIPQWGDLYDAIVPGLSKVVAAHRPKVCRWPAQASARGFAHLFFQHVRLPGQSGKGTPWSSAAGVMKVEGQPVLVGMVFRTAEPSAHGQEVIDSEEHWLRILRVA